ncbi:hypothetical protein AAG570_008502 [Ranatra chinensis]|uniref:Uncharacterized protein n=1 Tax=Ranatra chinensis TaxID=642074 RepID=A0ABD0YR27_9HEMI
MDGAAFHLIIIGNSRVYYIEGTSFFFNSPPPPSPLLKYDSYIFTFQSLTTVKDLSGIEGILGDNLETLELGECSTLSEVMATETLPKLCNLKKLRLERGQVPACPVAQLLNTIATLPKLTQLELINFDVKPGFDKALAKCTNLRTLLIIPTYVTQLSSTLTYFVWGLTLELLRVTDLFVDQVEGQKGGAGSKKGCGDSIPILKPIVEDGSDSKEGHTTSQVDILALPKLQKVLSTLLPTTKIKILKVPFSATWRQTVSDVPQ